MCRWPGMLSVLAAATIGLGQGPATIRVATFNVQDVRTSDLKDPSNSRMRDLAEVIQRLRPNVILLNEIAYDLPGAPGVEEGAEPGRNAARFCARFLAVAQATDTSPVRYAAFMAPVNTGMPSGLDLDNSGSVTSAFGPPPAPGPDGTPDEPDAQGRAYGGDCWGFGAFPGQYGMALLVDERLTILTDEIRTFRLLPWSYMPGALLPPADDSGEGSWFDDEEKQVVRLSSKSHWDVPVRLPNGAVIHFLCSHPTPPGFDGPEKRNGRRNHDEIRFWADYVENAVYFVDDAGAHAGLDERASFVILGDLNADPDEGDSFKDPLGTVLLPMRRINGEPVPVSDVEIDGLGPDDTAAWGMRVDYVLPSVDLTVGRCGVWRHLPVGESRFPSDHFPVWMELTVPAPPGARGLSGR